MNGRPARRQPAPALLVAGIWGRSTEQLEAAVARFEAQFGALELVERPRLPASGVRQAGGEMRLVAVRRPLEDPADLPGAFRCCGRLAVALGRPRQPAPVCFEPGLLSRRNLVLATAEPLAHAVYLGEGVYGELTLVRGEAGLSPLPWTRAPFGLPAITDLLQALSARLLAGEHASPRR